MNLEKILQNIKKQILLKENTNIGDIVLVGIPEGIFYATVRDISPDIKKNWYTVRFTILVMPPVNLAWTLRQPQMCGELFTINDEQHFMAAVDLGEPTDASHSNARERDDKPGRSGNVVPLLKKK